MVAPFSPIKTCSFLHSPLFPCPLTLSNSIVANNIKLEFYQKFAIPFASIPFVVLAFPLGLAARRSGRAVGFFIGLLLTSFYWSLLVLGRSLGLRTEISPFLVMIVPDLLLLGAGIFLYFRRLKS